MTAQPGRGPRLAEHLVYTWSRIGLEGPNQYQVRAASPGLHDGLSPDRAAARQLCRYSGPPSVHELSELPVCFGAIRNGTRRLVFRRVPLGVDSWGRSGGFFAHVVLADSHTLPGADAARLHDSEFWLEDERDLGDSTRLEALSLSRILPRATQPSLPVAQRAAFLTEVLMAFAAGRRIAVVGDWQLVAAHVAETLGVLPSVAADRLSFSTFEHGESVDWFDLVGVAPGDPAAANRHLIDLTALGSDGDRVSPPGHAAALAAALASALVLGGDAVTAAAADAATSARGSFSFAAYVDAHAVLNALSHGSPPGAKEVTRLLSIAATARLLVGSDVGAHRAAEVLVHAGNAAWDALQEGFRGLGRAERWRLAEALAAVAVDSGADTIDRVASLTSSLDGDLASGMLSAIHRHMGEEPSLASELSDGDALRLLVHATNSVEPLERSVSHLVRRRWTDPVGAAATSTVYAPWAAAILVPALADPRVRASAIRSLLGGSRRLIRFVGTVLASDEELIRLVSDAARMTSPHVLADFVLDLCSGDVPVRQRAEAASIAAARLDGFDRLEFLCAARPRIVRVSGDRAVGVRLAGLTCDALCVALLGPCDHRGSGNGVTPVSAAPSAGRGQPPGLRQLLAMLTEHSLDARAWAQILSGQADDPFSVWAERWSTPSLIAAMSSERQQYAAAETAFARAAWRQSDPSAILELQPLLAEWIGSGAEELAGALLRAARAGDPLGRRAPTVLLATVASLIRRGGLRLGVRGHLARPLQRLASEVAAGLSDRQRDALERWAERRPVAQRRWVDVLLQGAERSDW